MGFADPTRAERHSAAGRSAVTSRARATITSTWSSVSCHEGRQVREDVERPATRQQIVGAISSEYGLEVLLQSRDLGDTSGGEAGRARARRRCADQTALHGRPRRRRRRLLRAPQATPDQASRLTAAGRNASRRCGTATGPCARPDACAPTSRVARYARSHPGSDRRVARRQAPPLVVTRGRATHHPDPCCEPDTLAERARPPRLRCAAGTDGPYGGLLCISCESQTWSASESRPGSRRAAGPALSSRSGGFRCRGWRWLAPRGGRR
ncbi:MAG: hypothetical protein QOF69_2784 [Solirubrobacteraceae bacterium]|nr:hypothetical protein [Solirubrobacteraceae bacterium]